MKGRVIDEDGNPISGASVCTISSVNTKTADDGSFRLGGLHPYPGPGTNVYAKLEGFLATSRPIRATSLNGVEEVEFVLSRGASLSGRVVDPSGEPIANAVVSCNGYPNRTGPRTVRTGEGGEFELLSVDASANMLWARRDGWAAQFIRIAIPDPRSSLTDLEIVLTPGFELSGTLLDEDDNPIAGAEVRPTSSKAWAPGNYVGDSTYSRPDGRFVLNEFREDRLSLRVFAKGFADFEQPVEAGQDLVLRLQRSGGLAGQVVDGVTEQPIDSFTVRFVPARMEAGELPLSRYGAEWSQPGMSFTGTEGEWSSLAEPLTVGAVTGLEISASGYAPTRIERAVVTSEPSSEDLRIELRAGTVLRGYVVGETTGLPLSNARVRRITESGAPHGPRRFELDFECEARTDGEGRFELERIPTGRMFLAIDETDLPVYIDGPIDVDGSASIVERSIVVTSGGRVLGRYLDGEGHPLAHQTITLSALETPTEEEPSYTVETDATGQFEFEGLSPGPHHLRGTVTQTGASMPVGSSLLELVEVEDGRTLELDLRPRGSATLTGTIEFDGELPDDATVLLWHEQAPSRWAARAVEAPIQDGAFQAPFLEAGTWRVSLFLQVEGAMVAGGAEVQVLAGGTAEVRVELSAVRR